MLEWKTQSSYEDGEIDGMSYARIFRRNIVRPPTASGSAGHVAYKVTPANDENHCVTIRVYIKIGSVQVTSNLLSPDRILSGLALWSSSTVLPLHVWTKYPFFRKKTSEQHVCPFDKPGVGGGNGSRIVWNTVFRNVQQLILEK